MKKYIAFTLVEMLVVLIIVGILLTIGARSFQSIRRANAVNEVSLTITQDIRLAQRSAMLLERQSDERWIYGVGIDFTNMTLSSRNNPNRHSYTIFKFCAEENYFNDRLEYHTGEVPFNDFEISGIRRQAPGFTCRVGVGDVEGIGRINFETKSFSDYDFITYNFANAPRYILFQAVTGKAFMYERDIDDANMVQLLNYEENLLTSAFDLLAEVEPFELVIGGNIGPDRHIRVFPVSGIIYVDNLILRD